MYRRNASKSQSLENGDDGTCSNCKQSGKIYTIAEIAEIAVSLSPSRNLSTAQHRAVRSEFQEIVIKVVRGDPDEPRTNGALPFLTGF